MSEQENTALVQQAYGHFQSGDIPAVLDALSDDVEWTSPDFEEVPVSGTWRGREGVGEFFRTLSETQEVRQLELSDFVAQGDKVVALGHYAWHVKSTGREWESDFVHVLIVRDGKIARFQEYTNTAAYIEAFHEG